ncbi:MAG: 30S ribosome-binding factor RbfA [Gemmatimonadota bacterium]|nr:30S ribosome-binding factor RbfA [Gemmatimonadota bacterium]
MPNPRRADRLSESIREFAATFLTENIKDPRVVGLVTVTAVDVTQDMRHAKIFVSIMGTDDERKKTMEGLVSATGHLRSRIAKALTLRFAPEIEFREDRSVERAARIETLLAKIKDGAPVADEDPID